MSARCSRGDKPSAAAFERSVVSIGSNRSSPSMSMPSCRQGNRILPVPQAMSSTGPCASRQCNIEIQPVRNVFEHQIVRVAIFEDRRQAALVVLVHKYCQMLGPFGACQCFRRPGAKVDQSANLTHRDSIMNQQSAQAKRNSRSAAVSPQSRTSTGPGPGNPRRRCRAALDSWSCDASLHPRVETTW